MKVITKISRIVYRLELLVYQKIHNIFTVVQLKLIPSSNDLYTRLKPNKSLPIFVEDNDEFNKLYIIKRLLNKRVIRKESGLVTEYIAK